MKAKAEAGRSYDTSSGKIGGPCGIALAARRCHCGRGEVGKGLRILHEIFHSAAFLNFGVRKKPRGFSPLMMKASGRMMKASRHEKAGLREFRHGEKAGQSQRSA